jgi:hypothetical protein
MGFDEVGRMWICVYNRRSLVVLSPTFAVEDAVTDERGTVLKMPTNVAWGGAERRDLHVGSIALPHVLVARVDVPGLPQPWELTTPAGR